MELNKKDIDRLNQIGRNYENNYKDQLFQELINPDNEQLMNAVNRIIGARLNSEIPYNELGLNDLNYPKRYIGNYKNQVFPVGDNELIYRNNQQKLLNNLLRKGNYGN